MSTDALRREIDRHLSHLDTLRSLPPVTCTLARREWRPPAGGQPAPLFDVLSHPFLRIAAPFTVATAGIERGGRCAITFSPARAGGDALEEIREVYRRFITRGTDPNTPTQEAVRAAGQLNHRLSELLPQLPDVLSKRLGLTPHKLPYSWAETVIHLGWHFPNDGIETTRIRLQSSGGMADLDMPGPEVHLQLGHIAQTQDVFPGVVVSRLGEGSDFLTASGAALRLIRRALDGVERAARPKPHTHFTELRAEFAQAGVSYSIARQNLTARLFRLADSFRTPPATEWADFEPEDDGWGDPSYFALAHLNAERVVCQGCIPFHITA